MRWFALIVTVLLAAASLAFLIRWLLTKFRRLANGRDFRMEDRLAWQARWRELEGLLNEGGEVQQAIAVLEADKLFDRVLKSKALPGQDMGERLRFLTRSRPDFKFVWPAHLTRNRLVHEADFQMDRADAKRALDLFRRALRELGVF